jgi:cell division inhibitor SepF
MRKGEEFMSIFNKDALSSFFGLSGEEDDYYDNYEEYEERKAVNEPPRRAARPKPQRPVQQQESYSQPAYTQQSEPVVEKPSARYRSAEAHQERDTQQAAYTEKKVVSMRSSNQSATTNTRRAQESTANAKTHKITIIEPRVYSEAMSIAKHLFAEEAVLVNFTLVEEDQARRIVDFLTGTVYALDGDIQRVGNEIFLCTPANMEIDSATAQSLASKQFFDF